MRWKHMMPTYLMFFWSILRHSGVTTAATWKGWRVSSNWQSLPRWNLVKISLSQGVGNQHCCLFCPLFELCHWEVRVKVGGDKQAGQEGISKSKKFVSAKFFVPFSPDCVGKFRLYCEWKVHQVWQCFISAPRKTKMLLRKKWAQTGTQKEGGQIGTADMVLCHKPKRSWQHFYYSVNL